MKRINAYISITILSLLSISCYSNNNLGLGTSVISISNGKIKLGFDKVSGKLISFQNVKTSYDYISQKAVNGVPWRLIVAKGQPAIENIPTQVVLAKTSPLSL